MGFAQASLSVFGQELATSLLALVSNVFLARWLGPTKLGLFYIVTMLPSYADKFGRIGSVDDSAIYQIKNRKRDPGEVAGHLIWIFTLYSLIPILLYWIFAKQFRVHFLKNADVPDLYVWISVFTIPFMLFLICFNKLLLTSEKVRAYTIMQIGRPFLMMVIMFGFYFAKWDLLGVLLAVLISHIVVWAYGLWEVWRAMHPTFKLNAQLFKNLYHYGWKLYATALITFIHQRFDVTLVAYYLTSSDVSFYSVAVTLGQVLWKIPNSFSAMFLPTVSGEKPLNAVQFTARVCRSTTFILVVLSLAMLVLCVPATRIFYGARYTPIIKPLIYLLPGIVAMGVAKIVQQHFVGQGHPRAPFIATLISSPLNVLLNFLFLSKYGIASASLVSSLTYSFYLVLLIYEFKKRWTIRTHELLIANREDLRILYDNIRRRLQSHVRPV